MSPGHRHLTQQVMPRGARWAVVTTAGCQGLLQCRDERRGLAQSWLDPDTVHAPDEQAKEGWAVALEGGCEGL